MSVKISDLPAKGSALASTDLIEIAEVSGGAYVSKRVTGANVLGNFVPYTGATANVNLGTFHLDAAKGTFTHSGSTDTLTANHTSGSGIGLLITKGGANEGLKVNKTSGSGNAATIVGTLEATTIVKTGGTSTEFLMADGSTNTAVVPTTRTISTTSPLSGGGDLSVDRTLTIADAVADGTTKGAASFTASDFNSTSGNISIDYTNGQAASSSNKGFLTSTDWSTFNGKANKSSATSGIDISFRTAEVYNTRSSAGTGNLTGDYTSAIIGVVQKVYHNDSVAPTVPGTWIKLGTGTYTPSTLNIIYVEWTSSNIAEYWIVKGV